MSDASDARKARGWTRSALTKIRRCEVEFGFGSLAEMRYSRSRMRGAHTLLLKAAAVLHGLGGPATALAATETDRMAAEAAVLLAQMDQDIADVERWQATLPNGHSGGL